jgi:NAD-specific glutamate dehydrogenase
VSLFELLSEVVDEAVVEIFSTEMAVTSDSLDLENTFYDSKEGHIASSSTKIKDEHVSFADIFLVETVRDSSGCGFIDDTEDVQARDGSSVFGGLSLRIIEIGGDSDDSVVDTFSKVRFGSYFHLEENHRRDFFRRLYIKNDVDEF